MAFKIPVLPPGLNPNFKRVSYDEDALLAEPEVPTFEPVPTPPLPDTYGTVIEELPPTMYGPEVPPGFVPPTPQQPPEQLDAQPPSISPPETKTETKLSEHDKLKRRAEEQITEDVLAWLKKRKKPGVFDSPHFNKATMALYYAGLGKELPGEFFQGEDTGGKDLATGINMLNALKESKKGTSSDPNSNGSYNAQLALKNFLTTNKDKPQFRGMYEDLITTGRIWSLTQDDINKTYPKYISSGLSQGKSDVQQDQFGEREKRLAKQFAVTSSQAETRINQGWARLGLSKAQMVQNAAKNVKDLTPVTTGLDQLEQLIPGVTTRTLSDSELEGAGITTTNAALGGIPFGAGTWLQPDKYRQIKALQDAIVADIRNNLYGSALTGVELDASQRQFLARKLEDPKAFFKFLPGLAMRIKAQRSGMIAAAYSQAPELAIASGLVPEGVGGEGGNDLLSGMPSASTSPNRRATPKQIGEETKQVGNKTYVKRNGKWVPK